MSRRENSAIRRQQITAGLEAVMAERGYERSSVHAIAQAAELSPGLVHYHFKNKQQILLALIEHLAARLEGKMLAHLDVATSPEERLNTWVHIMVGLTPASDPRAVICWVHIGAEALRQPEVHRVWRRVMDREKDRLTGLISAAHPHRSAAREATLLMAAVLGIYQLHTAGLVPPGSAERTLRPLLRAMAT